MTSTNVGHLHLMNMLHLGVLISQQTGASRGSEASCLTYLRCVIHWYFHSPSLVTVKWQGVSYHSLLHKKAGNFICSCFHTYPSKVGPLSIIAQNESSKIIICIFGNLALIFLWTVALSWTAVLLCILIPSKMGLLGWALLAHFDNSWRIFFLGLFLLSTI